MPSGSHLLFEFKVLVSPTMLTGTDKATSKAVRLSLREPVADDGPAIYTLVEQSKPLDLNSRYCYLILCEHFSSTCVVAEHKGQVLAFMTAYIPPAQSDTLFIWQIAVHTDVRGQGVAKRLLAEVLARPAIQNVRFVEATVNPSNDASRGIFRSLARQYATKVDESLLFATDLLGDKEHEQENLIRVGPFELVTGLSR